MRKSIVIVGAFLLLMAVAPQAKAQIFITDEEEYNNSKRNAIEEGQMPFIPELGVTNDQYAPVGSGIAVLGLLGGAYLLGKRKRNE